MYNILNSGTTPCLRDFFSARSDNNNTVIIIFEIMILISRFLNLGKNFLSFRYRGAVLWNSLSYEAKTAQSIHPFKALI